MDTFDATTEGNPCYCRDFFQQTILGSEDCLVLNVYTKRLLNESKKTVSPVMFWIHGGGFVYGSGTTYVYGPEFLLTEDVVLVTINYRLGLLGFLALEDSSLGIPGNAGLKDMVMALRWVQTNIDKFGGDPNNVSVFGESAGGAAVQLLVLSPMSKGLFHKAIAQSGDASNPWMEGKRGVAEIADALGAEANEQIVYKSLLEKSTEEIFQVQIKMKDAFVASKHRAIGFVIERNPKETAFLPESPVDIMLSGNFNQVPFMSGYTSLEGMCFDVIKRPEYPYQPPFEDIVPWTFGYQLGSSESKSVANKIKRFYYGEEDPSDSNIVHRYDMLSDANFIYDIYVTMTILLKTSKAPLYFFRMSLESELNFYKNKIVGTTEPGVCHSDDLGYLFKTYATPHIKPGSIEDVSIDRFVKLWANFAKSGSPTPEPNDPLLKVNWKPLKQGQDIKVFDIGEALEVIPNPEQARMNFWKNLFIESPVGKTSPCSRLLSQQ